MHSLSCTIPVLIYWGAYCVCQTTSEADKAAFTELTELSDLMVAHGYMDIYSDTKEKIVYEVKSNVNAGVLLLMRVSSDTLCVVTALVFIK
jgi:hypothetical protein